MNLPEFRRAIRQASEAYAEAVVKAAGQHQQEVQAVTEKFLEEQDEIRPGPRTYTTDG